MIMDNRSSNSMSSDLDGASEINSAAEQDFLDSPDLAWVEPPYEQKITVVGNGTKMAGRGHV